MTSLENTEVSDSMRRVKRIKERYFTNLYYNPEENQFYTLNHKEGLSNYRPLKWNPVKRKYTTKKGGEPHEKEVNYKYVVLPFEPLRSKDQNAIGFRSTLLENSEKLAKNSIRLNQSDWDIMCLSDEMSDKNKNIEFETLAE